MSVADTPMRMVNDFPPNEQNGIASALWASLRLIIHQRLVPGRTGGRVALREFLVFQPKHCNRLYGTPLSKVTPVIQEMVTDDGQTLLADARRKYTDGAITDEAYRSIVKEFDEVMHG
jgi:defect-in-organelle-trafficking protein DotB